LTDYTARHFYDEESIQVQYSFPDYQRHRQLHEDFKLTVGSLASNFDENGLSAELSNNVNKTLVRWIINHITYEDKKIGDHIRKVESRF